MTERCACGKHHSFTEADVRHAVCVLAALGPRVTFWIAWGLVIDQWYAFWLRRLRRYARPSA